jgi:glycosyltransferase involved in cell wall biosynthesis
MLSICIPVYNVKVKDLVGALLEQTNKLNIPYEIIVMDDCSDPEFAEVNSRLAGITYYGLKENIGRAKIRNQLVKAAKYNYLLFLDCDSQMVSDDFLKAYLTEMKDGQKVVCGGRIYSKTIPEGNYRLHWRYGKNKESQPASVRMANSYQSFMTNNFFIEKKVLEAIPFDERLSGYGHEDTLLGYNLKKQNVTIKHIDNPILHSDLQTNEEFLQKTECAISNLKKILEYVNNDKAFIEDVMLLRYYNSLKYTGLLPLIKVCFLPSKSIIKKLLSKGFANMTLFNFYKLGYLSTHGNR